VTLDRRRLLRLATGAATFPLLSNAARAQGYPARPVTLIVFVGAGGSPDILARLVGQALSQRLGQAVVIDNRPGAGGNLALQAVARAPADGYTLLLVATPHAINATLYERSNVSVARDIVPIAGINSDSFAVLVNPSLPVKTLPELIAYAKANPGRINMASSGTGNMSHLAGALFRMMTGVDVVHVPYKSTPQALSAVMAGEVHLMFDALPSSLPYIQSGQLRALAVTVGTRVQAFPDVPPVAEFVPGYTVRGWLGVGAPKGTPADIVDRLNKEINAALTEPAVATRITDLGSTPLAGSPAEFGKIVAEETEKWANVIRAANIKVE
jgi:tripartite-type tricarboxylate transporter receptor subunit TctC